MDAHNLPLTRRRACCLSTHTFLGHRFQYTSKSDRQGPLARFPISDGSCSASAPSHTDHTAEKQSSDAQITPPRAACFNIQWGDCYLEIAAFIYVAAHVRLLLQETGISNLRDRVKDCRFLVLTGQCVTTKATRIACEVCSVLSRKRRRSWIFMLHAGVSTCMAGRSLESRSGLDMWFCRRAPSLVFSQDV